MNDMRSPGLEPPLKVETVDELSAKLVSGTEAVQLQVMSNLATCGDDGIDALINFLQRRRSENTEANYLDGKAYQTLLQINSLKSQQLLETNFPHGVVPLGSDAAVDYEPLQKLLASQDFQAADRITMQKMCEAAGSGAKDRRWLYFTEAGQIPNEDLKTINNLWLAYSEGKFGFSTQRKIWLGLGKNWEKFWLHIGWKKDGRFTRYPDGFIWSIDAPRGHLPLSNQIRGNKTIEAIFLHQLWY